MPWGEDLVDSLLVLRVGRSRDQHLQFAQATIFEMSAWAADASWNF
jgi:hypothetical protein